MPKQAQSTLLPRKSPVQERSTASVEAILKATVQVLISVGKERLTTTRVAQRAGVSVGTLYQYFPNKRALLRAALQRHMDEVGLAMEAVCREQAGSALEEMATALVTEFLKAKMKKVKISTAFYSISSDIDGAKIAQEMSLRSHGRIAALLRTAKDKLTTDPDLVASMLQATMAGVSRRLLESPSPEEAYEPLRNELVFLICAYLRACSQA